MTFGASSFDPFRTLLQVQQALDRVFENPVEWWTSGISGAGVFPPVNVFSSPDGYVVRVELPGLAADSIAVQSRGDTLQISGKRAEDVPSGASLLRGERWSGEFTRALRLPDHLDLAATQASYRNGVLTLRIPERSEAKPREIPVSGSAAR